MTDDRELLEGITKGAQSTFLIVMGKNVWIDPFQITVTEPKADVLFITHAHGDHLSVADMSKIVTANTIVVGPPDCIASAPVPENKKMAVAPGQTITVEGIEVEVVPAYNIGKPFHPRENNWVGYVLQVGDHRVYHAGDIDRIPELKNIHADVAFVPVGGTYTMNAAEAAAAVSEDLKPKLAVPIHYTVVGSDADAEAFVKALDGVEGRILKPSL